uniref:sister chromatid cohesion protein DCC1 n=1 Tax=Myxine glutinosa TaxID=7769 RepID=UPI00358EC280
MARTLEEVQATLEAARISGGLLPVAQSLTMAQGVMPGEMLLMEIDETLDKALAAGERLVVRGDREEKVVLCTDSTTYMVRVADTSNLLLVASGFAGPAQAAEHKGAASLAHVQICGFASSFLETRLCKPGLRKLRALLGEMPYAVPEEESMRGEDLGPAGLTTTELLQVIQSSEVELLAGLKDLHACQINGRWRMLSFDYEMRLLGLITQLVDSESWDFRLVPLSTCLEELEPLEPREMIQHCLECYGQRLCHLAEVHYALDEVRVCCAFAEMLLCASISFNLSEFMTVWSQSVPEGMHTDLVQLEGLVLVDRESLPPVISLMRITDLPEDVNERFNRLFTLRSRWREDDIVPYIRDLCGEKQTVAALLTKHTRCSVHRGVKMYGARRPIHRPTR